ALASGRVRNLLATAIEMRPQADGAVGPGRGVLYDLAAYFTVGIASRGDVDVAATAGQLGGLVARQRDRSAVAVGGVHAGEGTTESNIPHRPAQSAVFHLPLQGIGSAIVGPGHFAAGPC